MIMVLVRMVVRRLGMSMRMIERILFLIHTEILKR